MHKVKWIERTTHRILGYTRRARFILTYDARRARSDPFAWSAKALWRDRDGVTYEQQLSGLYRTADGAKSACARWKKPRLVRRRVALADSSGL